MMPADGDNVDDGHTVMSSSRRRPSAILMPGGDFRVFAIY